MAGLTKMIVWTASYKQDSSNNTSGQSIVTSCVVKEYSAAEKVVLYKKRRNSLVGYLLSVIKLYFLVAKNLKDPIYIVASRSKVGFVRDMPALLATFFSKGNSVIHLHGSDITDLYKCCPKILTFLYSRSIVVYPSNHLGKFFHDSQLGRRSICLENFLSISYGNLEDSDENDKNQDSLNILWNSNIIRSKGIFYIAKALEHLRSKEDNFNFTFTAIGSVSEPVSQVLNTEEQLKFYISEGVIDFLGSVSRDKVVDLLKIADLIPLISTYPSECQPLAIIEAMCFGKSIMCLDTPALRATVGYYPCFWITKGSSDFIVHQIVSVLSGDIHMPTEGDVEYARRRFSRSRFLEKFGNMKDEY
jgi:glycosyltransferase involved in cell wall biosynthesis